MNKRMWWMLVAVTVVFGGVFGFKWFGGKMMNQYFDKMPIPPATISAAAASPQRWDRSLEGVGTVVASQGTTLTTESGGLVATLHVDSGAAVKRGQLLVTLSSAGESADLRRLESQAQLASSELARQQRLFQLEAISRAELDRAEADHRITQAAVSAQRARLAQKEIRAPFAGRLGIRQASVGQYLAAGAPLFTLQALDVVFVDFSLPEQHLNQVANGQRVTVSVDSAPGREFTGLVAAIEPAVDSRTRNFKVRARLENPDGQLHPGQFARARIALGEARDVIAIPRSAVSYNPYGNAIFVIESSKGADGKDALTVQRRFIKTGDARGDLVAVSEGLKAGDRVATSGLLKLQNGSVVIINNTVTPAASTAPTPPNT